MSVPEEKKEESIENPAPQPAPRRAHTYDDDIARAMNATEAPVVQEFLSTARAREAAERAYRIGRIQRKWYSVLGGIFLVCAIGALGYGVYHYYRLTVPAEKTVSVGVFPSLAPIVAGETNIDALIGGLIFDPTIPQEKPFIVPLVTDATTLTPISKADFFSFIKARTTEPFAYSIDTIRLGVFASSQKTTPFIILSVRDPQIASKEFLIAEPTLIQLFSRALGMDVSRFPSEIGATFESTYLYNMPVRMLSLPMQQGGISPMFLYGYATQQIIVIASDPAILKAVYDTLIRQQ